MPCEQVSDQVYSAPTHLLPKREKKMAAKALGRVPGARKQSNELVRHNLMCILLLFIGPGFCGPHK